MQSTAQERSIGLPYNRKNNVFWCDHPLSVLNKTTYRNILIQSSFNYSV